MVTYIDSISHRDKKTFDFIKNALRKEGIPRKYLSNLSNMNRENFFVLKDHSHKILAFWSIGIKKLSIGSAEWPVIYKFWIDTSMRRNGCFFKRVIEKIDITLRTFGKRFFLIGVPPKYKRLACKVLDGNPYYVCEEFYWFIGNMASIGILR